MYKKTAERILGFLSFLGSSRTAFILFLEMLFGIFLTTGSYLLFFKISHEVLEKDFTVFDTQILQFFYTMRTPLLNGLMIFVTDLGGNIMIILGITIALLLLIKGHKKEAFLFGFILVMAVIINNFLKITIERPRPNFYPLVLENSYSFPSGHAMDSFVFYATLSYLFFRITKNKKAAIVVSAFSTLLVLLIGISRVYLGVHYPTDVIAGYIGGLGWFVSVLVLEKTITFFGLFNKQ